MASSMDQRINTLAFRRPGADALALHSRPRDSRVFMRVLFVFVHVVIRHRTINMLTSASVDINRGKKQFLSMFTDPAPTHRVVPPAAEQDLVAGKGDRRDAVYVALQLRQALLAQSPLWSNGGVH